MLCDEQHRQNALRRYAVIDSPPEPNFDRLTRLASSIFDHPVCTLALADSDRFWFKARHGVNATEMPRRMAFCEQTISGDDVFVVHDALRDDRFAEAPMVASAPHVRFYAGAPLITPSGARIGSLCVLNTQPQPRFTFGNRAILSDLAHTAVELLEARARQIELARCTDEIAHLARHDPLTGLPNRRRLQELAETYRMDPERSEGATLLYLDLDGFKLINDHHGHLCGDALLEQVADRLRDCIPNGSIVARLGGDEFAVLTRDSSIPAHYVEALAGRLVDVVRHTYHIGDRQVAIGVSIGVAKASHAWTLDGLLAEADRALYIAKAKGRGCYHVA